MPPKPARLAIGSADTLRALKREPALIGQLPRWARDAGIRKDPLLHRMPWWNYKAIAFVDRSLPANARVFEYGGGASTLWLRDRGATVTTIEDNASWLGALREAVPDADLRYVAPTPGSSATPEGPFDEYAHAIDTEPDCSFDLVIIDGQARRECLFAAEPKVKPGGMLLLDDSQASDTEPPPRADLNLLRWQYLDFPTKLAGWQMHHLRGLKPGHWMPVQTSIWIKPFA
jgi:hypothetical protein